MKLLRRLHTAKGYRLAANAVLLIYLNDLGECVSALGEVLLDVLLRPAFLFPEIAIFDPALHYFRSLEDDRLPGRRANHHRMLRAGDNAQPDRFAVGAGPDGQRVARLEVLEAAIDRLERFGLRAGIVVRGRRRRPVHKELDGLLPRLLTVGCGSGGRLATSIVVVSG